MDTNARRVLVWAAGLLAALSIPLVAAAKVTPPCDGRVVIDGKPYTPANDTPKNPIVVPDKPGLVAEWSGNTETPAKTVIKDFTGHVSVFVGPFPVQVADWEGPNTEESTSAKGNYSIDDARGLVPVGLYRLEAVHAGANGASCTADVYLLIEGNPLTTPVGAGSAAGTALAAVGMVMAGRRRGRTA